MLIVLILFVPLGVPAFREFFILSSISSCTRQRHKIAIVKMKYFITMSLIGGSESSRVTRIIHPIPSTTAIAFVAFFA